MLVLDKILIFTPKIIKWVLPPYSQSVKYKLFSVCSTAARAGRRSGGVGQAGVIQLTTCSGQRWNISGSGRSFSSPGKIFRSIGLIRFYRSFWHAIS